MAGIARHLAFPGKVRLIKGIHHQDHSAGHLFTRIIQRVAGRVGWVVAFRAVHAQSRGNKTHGAHELVHGESAKHLNILENVVRHQRLFLLGSLTPARCCSQQAHR